MAQHSKGKEGGNIDPMREDIATGKKPRRPRQRKVPAPPKSLTADKAASEERAHSRPLSPGVMLEDQGEDKGWLVTAPHGDIELWELQMGDAFGTRSQSVMRIFLNDLRKLVPEAWDEKAKNWKTNEQELNAALAMVADIKPRNVMEAALAAEMVAVHRMQMQVSAAAINSGHYPLSKEAGIAGKLARTFAGQLKTLQQIRGETIPIRQDIHVTKETHAHVHYHGGEGKTERQPHERTIEHAADVADECEALRSNDKSRKVVPLPRAKGQG